MKYIKPNLKSPNFPFYFRIARALYALLSNQRGEYFFYSLLGRWGLLRRAGRFPFFDSHIYIPLDIPDTLFITDFSLYQGLREINFANVIYRTLGDNATLIDCGAAFGQISCRLAKLCPNIQNIISIEPNSDNCLFLQHNLDILQHKSTHLMNVAVSNFKGKGELRFPLGHSDSHSAYIQQSEAGTIDVIRLDDLLTMYTNDIALKLDIEGGELSAIEGAIKTISRAANICFFIEIHPDVLETSA